MTTLIERARKWGEELNQQWREKGIEQGRREGVTQGWLEGIGLGMGQGVEQAVGWRWNASWWTGWSAKSTVRAPPSSLSRCSTGFPTRNALRPSPTQSSSVRRLRSA